MDDLITDFIAECREMLEALGGEIVAWEADPADRARLDSIFRFVHTVKGNCGFFDFPRLEALSHAAEDTLADVRSGRRQPDSALVSAVLAVIDRIGEMVDAIDAGSEFPDGGDSALIKALDHGSDAAEAEACFSASAAADKPARALAVQRTIRLPVDLLDRLMNGVSDMVLARNDLARHIRELATETAVDGPFDRLSTIIADMRDAITRTRMQRIDNLFSSLPRLVRDLSAELGKQVMVDIEGGDVELDREMIELIRDPLTHVIRNALDHGIEAPTERLAAGKHEIGLLTVLARQSGNQILIEIADDGRGIDGAKLVEKAIEVGLIDAAEGARLSPRARHALIFEPGLSTAEAVTAISGRGVGMDVVRSNVDRIGGVIEIDSTPNKGTRVTLRVPLTLTIIPALTISIAGQSFAIPRTAIEEIVHAGGDSVEFSDIGGALLVKVRERRVPCLALADVLGVAGDIPVADRTLVMLRLPGDDMFALAVDRIHDHEELVVKPAAPAVMATGIYAGTTLADDGSPILLLDVTGLAQVGGIICDAQERSARVSETAVDAAVSVGAIPVLLFIGLDGRKRAMRRAVVDHIEEVDAAAVQMGAGQLRVVISDKILPLAGVGTISIGDGPLQLFRLSDGASEIGYAVREVLDTTTIETEVIAATTPGEIEGMALIDGEPAEIVDAHWLFEQLAGMPLVRAQPVCRLPSDDAWMQNFLRPLVEAAGYLVVDERDQSETDLAIASQEVAVVPARAGHVIWLRSNPDTQPDRPDSIYRYDRASLMAALRTAHGGRNG